MAKIQLALEEELITGSLKQIQKQVPDASPQDICSLLMKYSAAIAFETAESPLAAVSFLTGLFNELIQEGIKGEKS